MKLEFLFAEEEKSELQRFVHKYNNYIPADARVSTHGVSLHMKSSICYLNNELDHNAQESPQTGYMIYIIYYKYPEEVGWSCPKDHTFWQIPFESSPNRDFALMRYPDQ